ncbi:hypothetical protein [Mycobacteroides saopaulense]|uniref:hypothetical protein n=1 Tax=Mycobacteroides saopaulense TaxID=1578165 RepID=UPI0012FF75F5|nr:hypothetical protein [Mycobacteroides saopaulense]
MALIPPISDPGNRIQARNLEYSRHHGRRIRINGIAGIFQGIAMTTALALRADGTTVPVPGEPSIHLKDDAGRDHHLRFKQDDQVELLD